MPWPFELPPLPYARDALAPHISAETIDYHYGKHHQTYVTNLNNLIKGTEFENSSSRTIVQEVAGRHVQQRRAGLEPHVLLELPVAQRRRRAERQARPTRSTRPSAASTQFKDEFTKTAIGTFGSGWAWLVQRADGSARHWSARATPTRRSPAATRPLLTCDVWEHAYYIDYRNARPKYVEAFWNLVNWDFAASQMA